MSFQDSSIFERLSPTANSKEELDTFKAHLDEYACKGYRTLCLASAEINPQFYAKWVEENHKACCSMDNREQRMADAAEKIEAGDAYMAT